MSYSSNSFSTLTSTGTKKGARMWNLRLGENVASKKIKKHKNDMFCLFQIILREVRVELPQTVDDDMVRFFDALSEEPGLSLKDFGLEKLGVLDVIGTLRNVYNIHEQQVGRG